MRIFVALLWGCAPQVTRTTETPPPRAPAMPVEGELLPGTECQKVPMPSWRVQGGSAELAGFKVKLPAGWTVETPRGDLVVLTAPKNAEGVRNSFEVFVSPRCKTYQLHAVHERIAARGLLELLPREQTIAQMQRGNWTGGIGGRAGRGIVLEVTLETARGPRKLVVWGSDVADADTVGVHAAAVCAAQERQACEDAYFNLLESSK